MPLVVHTPAGDVRIADLPVGVLGDAARLGDKQWYEVLDAPIADDRVGVALLRAACESNGSTPPAVVTAQQLLDAFDLVDDDLPTAMADGTPKEVAEETTPS